jgi:hypothetical protein
VEALAPTVTASTMATATDRSPGLATGEKRRLPGLVGRANEHLVDGHPAVAGHDVNDGVSDVSGSSGSIDPTWV